MTYVLNTTTDLPVAARTEVTKKAAGPSFWQRLYAAMIESRRRSAMRELRAYSYLARESELILGGYPKLPLNADAELPFNR